MVALADILTELIEDTLDVLDLAEDLAANHVEDGGPEERGREAVSIFYEAAKRLAATPLAALRDEGLDTSLSDGWFS